MRMANIAKLLTEHIDIWTAADTEKKSGRGRASGNAGSVYGVKKLRELILELAVRGKLVPQDPNDEPASELLKRIQAEKAKLIAEGKLKKEKPLAPIGEDEKPFALPMGWGWVRFSEFVLSIMSGGTPSKNNPDYWNGNVPWASVKDLNVEKYLEKTEDFITEAGLLAGSKLANKGDLIICTRMGLGKIAIASLDVAINQDLKSLKLTTFLSVDYFIKFYSTLKIAGSGMTVAGIRQEELLGYCVPLPPLAEQHRIVAKVDELMALCDQLEQQHSNAQEAHETLVSQLLATLTQSQNQNAAEFNANWQRIYAHFDVLFTTEASIDALKQTLLQLAVMGKLVPQDPSEIPASELLKRIQAEKVKLIAEGKLKKEKTPTPIEKDEKPFELPQGWEWAKVLDCSIFVTDGEHLTPQRTSDGLVPLVTAKNVRDGYMDYEDTDFVDVTVADKCWKRCKPEQGDLLMVSVGATLGRLTVLLESKDMVIVRSVTLIRPCLLSPLYLFNAIKSPLIQKAIWSSVRQMAQPGLYLAQSSNLVFPLPPLEEQHRIVAKVDTLMALCDQLKTRIQQANQQQQAIANALVAQAVI